nr:hypothetical protein BaRGS_014041 [Batillaria attramentaria]
MATPLVRVLEVGVVGVALLTVYCALTTPTVLCLTVLVVLWAVYRWERKRAAGTVPLNDKHVLITGCDSGFGFAFAKHAHGLGCHVIATVLRPDGQGAKELRDVSSSRMTVLPLDVSSDESVRKCLEVVRGMCNGAGLWGLVNNAGQQVVGDVELTTMSQYLRVANVNLFGMVRTTRAFLPLIRQAKGRIVNVTSVRGRMHAPYQAAYNITKHGAETFSDIVRLEMRQFGVKVVVIEPGDFSGVTEIIKGINLKRIEKDFEEMWAEASDDVKKVYDKEHLDQMLVGFGEGIGCPTMTPVSKAITEALTSEDPEFRYLVDGSSGLIDKYCSFLN